MDNPVQLNFDTCTATADTVQGLFVGDCSKTSDYEYTMRLTLNTTNPSYKQFSCEVTWWVRKPIEEFTWADRNLPHNPKEAKNAIVQLLREVSHFGPVVSKD
jgi:hypothetical protein